MNTPLPFVPMDPADVDRLPPDDIDACPACLGAGEVLEAVDENGQPIDRACSLCDGYGYLPELGGAA